MGSPWEGSELVEAERCLPSSKRGHRCGGIQAIGRAERWACDGGGSAASAMATRRSTWARSSPGAPREGCCLGAIALSAAAVAQP